jgi:superfamily I DNA and/or RNA helicase
VDTAGAGLSELRDPVTQSLYNPGEIDVIVTAVQRLLDAGVDPSDLGVLAPYSAQVGRLRLALPAIEVATVNAFQGREKEAILCSFVRSNDTGELGFVADGRRLTVALSRARRFVLAVGDSATLAAHRRFAEVFDQLAESEGLVSVFEPPWDAALDQS